MEALQIDIAAAAESSEDTKPRKKRHPFMGDYDIWFFTAATLFYEELMLELVVYGTPSWALLYSFFFGLVVAGIISLICGFFPKLWNRLFFLLLLGTLVIYYEIQLIYHKIFGTFMELVMMRMGAAAVTSFFKETVNAIWHNLIQAYLLFIPLIVLLFAYGYNWISTGRRGARRQLKHILTCTVGLLLFLLSLLTGGTGLFSPLKTYFSDITESEQSIRRIGLLATAQAELRQAYIPDLNEEEGYIREEVFFDDMVVDLIEDVTSMPSEPQTIMPLYDTSPQILEGLDFAELESENGDITWVNEYMQSRQPTYKNQYTGLFKDYNLIAICAESFCSYAIDEERTPTLWKLSHEGVVFENYYGTFPNTTTDGEYTFCMGIFPDLSRSKSDASFRRAAENYLPFCFGNVFQNLGVKAFAYHNYKGSYYDREASHPAMGYSCKFMGAGLDFPDQWPNSDLEMMEQSMPDYLDLDRFCAYYMTFSGHYEYDFAVNPMAVRHQDEVAELPYSEPVKAYIACHMEVENALTYILNKLEEYGKLDNTLIVLTNDHYPYGLREAFYNELAGHEVDTTFEKYENTFICWANNMKSPIVVEDYCCTTDILPTVLNLLGVDYDSRLLMGRDVLAEGEHIAILRNKSFISPLMKFDSTENEAIYLVDEDKVPEWYLESKNAEINDMLKASQLILNTDYYRYLWEKIYGLEPNDQEKVWRVVE